MTLHRSNLPDQLGSPEKKARVTWVFLVFILTNALVAFSPLARAAIVFYPASCFLVSLFVIRRSKPAYTAFICWLWLLTPFVRRVVEWRAGGTLNLILLAPYVSIGVAALFLVPKLSQVLTRRTMPLLFALAAVCYGVFVGILHLTFTGLPQAVIAWAMPPLFALFLFGERSEHESIYKSFEMAMVIGLFVIGAYGIYQFFMLPEWDAQWMIQSDLQSIGLPEPFQVRVFSTMNSPQVFAAFCAAGLLVALRSHLKIRYLAIPAGFISLVLSLSRTAWMGLTVGVLYLFCLMPNRQRIRIVAAVGCCLIVSFVALQVPEVNTIVMMRFNSLADPQHDSSYEARMHDYNTVVQTMIDNPFGHGLSADAGSGDQSAPPGAISQQDSSITASLFSLGLLGTTIFGLGLLLLGFGIFSTRGTSGALIGAKATLLAIAIEAPFNNVISGPVGFLLWCCIGLCIAECETVNALDLNHDPGTAQASVSPPAAIAS
ncbi:O-antigen ligase family protein [Alloacidobacterium dinghuense]|uniref:O-antigen ligase family protein n=1 Tax=Alloacidobacterium dinghuense TaxID=2763107 RepID=A0A7G8BI75_9BACT|nr:O-antigen ligase family protein [Alloacidobacterium dinghuense]QNI32245.1 O-antigen ligase family protein [Alloacidobacterium dinghuense]